MGLKSPYKQTECGIIPDEWITAPIGSLVTDFRGGAPLKPSDFTEHGVMVLPKGGVGRKGWLSIDESSRQYCSPSYAQKHLGNTVHEEYTIVVLRDLVPSGPSIGLMVRIRATDLYVLAQGVYGFKVCAGYVPAFLTQLSNTAWYRKTMNSIMVGSTQVHITNTTFKRTVIPLPPTRTEQEAIAEALGDADALIESLERLIDKNRQIKQGTMQELLTGKHRLPGFSGAWETKRLGDVATFHKGKGLPKSALKLDGPDTCIHYGELFTCYAELITRITNRTCASGATFRSVANDVLMPTSDVTPRGLAKASCVLVDGVILGGDILVIRPNSRCIFGPFVSYLIRYEEDQVLKLVRGSTVFHLYGADMKKFTFVMPPFVEQTAIAKVLSDMDSEIEALEARLAKARQVKQGMMQELLTGRIRLV